MGRGNVGGSCWTSWHLYLCFPLPYFPFSLVELLANRNIKFSENYTEVLCFYFHQFPLPPSPTKNWGGGNKQKTKTTNISSRASLCPITVSPFSVQLHNVHQASYLSNGYPVHVQILGQYYSVHSQSVSRGATPPPPKKKKGFLDLSPVTKLVNTDDISHFWTQ